MGELSFIQFVISLASSAAIHFGDLADPSSGRKSEVNLQGAAQMIDILTLLDAKTRGNLTAEERQLLADVLYELRLRFARLREEGYGGAADASAEADRSVRRKADY
jgi:hypothetical protein